jgi:predicted nucleotidyltransferase component of viral defense system
VSSRLDDLQVDILRAFFRHTHAFRLTGGAALGGFYLFHRRTEDLDLFAAPPTSIGEGERALRAAASELGVALEIKQDAPDFKRFVVAGGGRRTVVDMVIDRVPRLDPDVVVEGIHLESEREILGNKVCTLLSRMEPRDLVDLRALLARGYTLEDGLGFARRKDGGADPATLAWVLSTWRIPASAPIPDGTTLAGLESWKAELVDQLTRLAVPPSS